MGRCRVRFGGSGGNGYPDQPESNHHNIRQTDTTIPPASISNPSDAKANPTGPIMGMEAKPPNAQTYAIFSIVKEALQSWSCSFSWLPMQRKSMGRATADPHRQNSMATNENGEPEDSPL